MVSVGRELHTFSETAGDLLTMLSFLVFGLLLGPTLPDLTWTTVLYAVLSLTVLRIVPVWLSQVGSHLSRGSLLYLGWFGPRGLATLLLALEVAGENDLTGADTIVDVALFTVGLSVLLHGVTAWWGSNAYADYVEGHPDGDAMPEHARRPRSGSVAASAADPGSSGRRLSRSVPDDECRRRRGAEQHRHEDAEWQRAPVADGNTEVAEKEHEQPRRREGGDQEDDECCE